MGDDGNMTVGERYMAHAGWDPIPGQARPADLSDEEMTRAGIRPGDIPLYDPDSVDRPPLGVPPRHVMVAEAGAEGWNVDEYIRSMITEALRRGWRPSPGQQEDLLIDADGQPLPPAEDGAEIAEDLAVGTLLDREIAASDALPMRRRTPPPKPLPPQPKRADPLPIRFARQVLAMDPPPAPGDGTFESGEWQRLDIPVSRSIISKKCREFAEAYGVKLSIRVDHVDPDDPTSPRKPHLWCCIVEDDADLSLDDA